MSLAEQSAGARERGAVANAIADTAKMRCRCAPDGYVAVCEAYEGRGGQQLLLARQPFCPARDCQRPCHPHACTCRPCSCGCRGHLHGPGSALPFRPFFSPPPVHPRLFAAQPTKEAL